MSVIVQDILEKGPKLRLANPRYLLETLTDEIDCTDIETVSYNNLRVGFWERQQACWSEKQIKARGRYKLELSIDNCYVGDRIKRLGHLLVEKGEVEDCAYERIALQTKRPATLIDNDRLILPTLVDITVNEVDESVMRSEGMLYVIQRSDSNVVHDLFKTKWFLSQQVREAIKEGKVYFSGSVPRF